MILSLGQLTPNKKFTTQKRQKNSGLGIFFSPCLPFFHTVAATKSGDFKPLFLTGEKKQVTYFFFPETTGRSLEEVDEIFLQSTSIFDTVKVSLQLPRQNLSKFGVAIEAARRKEENRDRVEGGGDRLASGAPAELDGDEKAGVRAVEDVTGKV